jgi:cytochrome c oxidase subunit 1
MYGRFLNPTLGKIHFWGTLVGAYAVFGPMHYLGVAGVARRYYSFDVYQAFGHFDGMNQFITIAAIVTFVFQIIFVVNFFLQHLERKKGHYKKSMAGTYIGMDYAYQSRAWKLAR